MKPKRSYVPKGKGKDTGSSSTTGASARKARTPRDQPIIPVDMDVSAVRARFDVVENFEWFEKVKGRGFIVEKSIHADLETMYPLRDLMNNLGWGPILDIKGAYYPDLVWEFYASIEQKESSLKCIHTSVRGHRLRLSPLDFADLLGVPNVGPFFEIRMGTIHSEIDLIGFEAVLGYHFQPCSNRSSVLTHSIPVIERLLALFFSYNVIPRKSGSNELRRADMYFLYKIIFGLGNITGVPLGSVIIQHIRSIICRMEPPQNAPFPVLISRLLVQKGVPVLGERVFYTGDREVVGTSTLNSMGLIWCEGLWYRNPNVPNFTPHERDPPMPASFVHDVDPLDEFDDRQSVGGSQRTATSRRTGGSRGRQPESKGRIDPDVWEAIDSMRSDIANLREDITEIRRDMRFIRMLFERVHYPPPPPDA